MTHLKEQHNREVQKKIDENRDKIEDIDVDLRRRESRADSLRNELKNEETVIGQRMIEKKNCERDIEYLTSTFWTDSK